MSELRLAPAAVAVWLATMFALLGRWMLVAVVLVGAGLALWWFRLQGQALLTVVLGGISVLVALVRQKRAGEYSCPSRLSGTAVTDAKEIETDFGSSWLVPVGVSGYPVPLPVFVDEEPAVVAGQSLTARITCSEATRPGVGSVTAQARVVEPGEVEGFAAWAAQVADTFRQLVQETVGPASQGLMPGMVLGDVSLQDAEEQQLYIHTGLSHLSAVSGANVAVVCSCAAVVAAGCAAGPKVKVAASLGALAVFVGLVGTEPSVLRAAVAGIVGLLAVLNSSRMQPLHALCIGVIVLIIWDSDLALSFAFALSSAATAGIVVLSPLLNKLLVVTGWPAIVTRALAVAIAADLVTMPIVALMAGEVSVVSVLANTLVAPVTAPVTVLGLIAVLLAQLGPLSVLAAGLLKVIEPCTWWINTVAHGTVRLPVAVIDANPLYVLLAYGWIVAGLLYERPWLTLGATMLGVVGIGMWGA
ncbi:ComEC/Rec2 family competence protein [Corynebacterium camporealensis]